MYVQLVTLPTNVNAKLLQQLEQNQSKVTMTKQNQYLDYCRCGENSKHRILSLENGDKRLQCYNQWQKLFWLTSKKNDIRTYDNIWKIATGQGDDYITGFLLDYLYFKEHYKTITIALSKEQALGVDLKAIL